MSQTRSRPGRMFVNSESVYSNMALFGMMCDRNACLMVYSDKLNDIEKPEIAYTINMFVLLLLT